MSVLDPARVYWFWRRKLLDFDTPADTVAMAQAVLQMLERWYPALVHSAPPADEATGEPLSHAVDFVFTYQEPNFVSEMRHSRPFADWRTGDAAWCFAPEVPGHYVAVVGVAGDRACVFVLADPRIRKLSDPYKDKALHVWVAVSSLRAPTMGGYGTWATQVKICSNGVRDCWCSGTCQSKR